jgi:exodeoxyribonuclease-5
MEDLVAADQVLAYRNATCHGLNDEIRRALGYTTDLPGLDDRLLCLRNNYDIEVFNGEIFRVTRLPRASRYGETVSMKVMRENLDSEDEIRIKVHPWFFTNEQNRLTEKQKRESHWFDYGYAITVHKAQGSQWDNVLIFNESASQKKEPWKWLYTAITRARKRVTLVL